MSQTVAAPGKIRWVGLALTPEGRGSPADQAAEVLARMRDALRGQGASMHLVSQTVFLRDIADLATAKDLFEGSKTDGHILRHYVVEPPANGVFLALEAWIVEGPGVTLERISPHAVAVSHDGIRWLHLGGLKPRTTGAGVYADACDLFQQAARQLNAAGLGWQHVVRTWWQLERITATEGDSQRYLELNRARTDAFAGMRFGNEEASALASPVRYPASTAIGMEPGAGLTLGALAMETSRSDVRLIALENPWQTPAYDYAPHYSPQSPKFSRAMAMIAPEHSIIWVSGTASILNSELCHPDDIVAQTEQALDNIMALIAPENFATHGVPDTGATLADLTQVRVYIKHADDYAACRAVCDRRLGNLPAIHVLADICRPELLVEIEGVAFLSKPNPQ